MKCHDNMTAILGFLVILLLVNGHAEIHNSYKRGPSHSVGPTPTPLPATGLRSGVGWGIYE